MNHARPPLAFAALLVAGLAAPAAAQLASSIHVVSAANRDCPPENSCSALLGTSWYSGYDQRFHLATSNWNPVGAPGVFYPAPIGAFLNEPVPGGPSYAYLVGPEVELPYGAAYNLLTVRGGVGAPSCIYTHSSAEDNILANVTFLDVPALNGHPEAFVLVLPFAFPTAITPANVGLYYDSSRSQWGIFNEDLTAMPANRWFTVYDNTCAIGLGNRYLFTCNSPELNRCGMGGLIENGNPAVRLLVTQLWDASAPVYNPHPVGVYYEAGIWKVFNEDLANMPIGAKFNVAVIDVLLDDDFETGDFTAWTTVVP